VRLNGVLHATPLFVTLLFVEVTDIIFAVDSVPAIYALTGEPLIVFVSNVFAILGLRALYFLLAGMMNRFYMLKYGLAVVLMFVGLKIAWLNDLYGGKFPITISLGIIAAVIAISVIASLLFRRSASRRTPPRAQAFVETRPRWKRLPLGSMIRASDTRLDCRDRVRHGKPLGHHWHHLPPDEVLDLLDTDGARGLDRFEVENRQRDFGPNVISAKTSRGPVLRFLLQFHQPLVYILIVSGLVTAVLKGPLDAAVILGVVLINAVVGFLQEAKAEQAIEALSRRLTTEATVVRAGEKRRVPSTELVPGDLLFLQAGDKAPADVRLIQVKDLQADESALTGESAPVAKVAEVLPHDTVLADRKNMVYGSALLTYGRDSVSCSNRRTERDRTHLGPDRRSGRPGDAAHPQDRQVQPRTGRHYRGLRGADLCRRGVAWAAVGGDLSGCGGPGGRRDPEGLPAAVTITLAIGVARMARRHAIIRKLPAVETLVAPPSSAQTRRGRSPRTR